MALRIRADGTVLCAAMHPEQPGDTYLDDGLHYRLSVDFRVLVTEPMELPDGRGHGVHGQWWWRGAQPAWAEIDPFYLTSAPGTGADGAALMPTSQPNENAPRVTDDVLIEFVRERYGDVRAYLCESHGLSAWLRESLQVEYADHRAREAGAPGSGASRA